MPQTGMNKRYDYVIVGAGSAGCVLANRLSANPAHEVVLVEAGPDTRPGKEPATILDLYPRSYADPRFQWPDLRVRMRRNDPGTRRIEQGRVIGGSSSIMGMVALRGVPEDYDEWSSFGLRDWSWQDVLPHFKRLEHDCDFAGPGHGSEGPITIRRHPVGEWPPFCKAVADALRGYPRVADVNTDFRDGVGAVPVSRSQSSRMSAAIGFLDAPTRKRGNLTILTGHTMVGLRMEGRRATGVFVRVAGDVKAISTREVILSTGTLRSPAILLHAGIGDATWLHHRGIPVVADRPGVGLNLLNHPAVYLATLLKPAGRQSTAVRSWGMNLLRYSSSPEPSSHADMLMFIVNKTSWHAVGRQIGSLGVSVYKAYSQGRVLLREPCPDSGIEPDVDMNLLSDERDLARLTSAVRMAYFTLTDPVVAALCEDIFASPTGELVRRLHAPGWRNATVASLAATAMASSRRVRSAVARRTGSDIASIVHDDDELRAFVRDTAVSHYHFVGTCRMGSSDDRLAVVDGSGRVIGVDGLRVVDGSILPTIPRANTYLPIMMVAEKISHDILRSAA